METIVGYDAWKLAGPYVGGRCNDCVHEYEDHEEDGPCCFCTCEHYYDWDPADHEPDPDRYRE